MSMPPKKPVIALIYDFDKTLSTKNMQEYGFIPSVGMRPDDFWRECDDLAVKHRMDRILAYMYVMVDKARNVQSITSKSFQSLGKGIAFYPGLETWFGRVNAHVIEAGATPEHYIISSGLEEIIRGTPIAQNFKAIFASRFFYNPTGMPVWPAQAINYTNKTQYLFRINKGVLDPTEDDALNRYVEEEDRPIPFRNMIYFGDGLTDVPSMKQVRINGGCSIAVYPNKGRPKVDELLTRGRVDYIFKADYSEGKELEKTVIKAIDRMVVSDNLIRLSRDQMRKSLSKTEQQE